MSEFNLIIEPDKEEMEAAEVYVDATVGTDTYRFLLDTGAARTCIPFNSYTSAFSSSETSSSSGVFARSSQDLVTVPTIRLGPICRENITVTRLAEGEVDVRNLIGMDVLKDSCCHFLFNESRVRVDPTNIDGYETLDLLYDERFHPYIDVGFEELQAKAVWDTGASVTVVDASFIEKHPLLFKRMGQSEGTDSTGHKMETPMYVMAATIIGNNIFPPHKVAGVDLTHVNSTIEIPMDLILGYSTLSKANWLFNFPRKQWAVTKLLEA